MTTRSQDGVVEWSPDQRFGRFEKVKGEGSSKTVYEACDADTGNMVAWNVVPVSRLSEADRARVADEIATLSRMQHERLMSVIATWSTADAIIFITAIVDSGDLRSFYKKHHAKLRIIKRWCRQILAGLSYLHEHSPPLVHRDIKCENILLNTADSTVRISDLGLCTTGTDEASACGAPSTAASFGGTFNYMAPEAFDGHIDWSVDIYAFGLTLCELVTRELPYKECNFCQIFAKSRSGVLPDSFYRIKYPSIQEFIRHCVTVDATTGHRPTAGDLLAHPFLDETLHPQEDEMDDLVWPGTPPKDDAAPTSSNGDMLLEGGLTQTGSGSHAAYEQLLGGERAGVVVPAAVDANAAEGAPQAPSPLPLHVAAEPEDVLNGVQLTTESPMVSDRSIGTHPSASPSITESGAVTSSIDGDDGVADVLGRGRRRSSGASELDIPSFVRHETAARIRNETSDLPTARSHALRMDHMMPPRDASPELLGAHDAATDEFVDNAPLTGRSSEDVSAHDADAGMVAGVPDGVAARSERASFERPTRAQHRHGVSILGPGDVPADVADMLDRVNDDYDRSRHSGAGSFIDADGGHSDVEHDAMHHRIAGDTAGSELADVIDRERHAQPLGFEDGRGSALPDDDEQHGDDGGVLERARALADPDHADESAFDRHEHLQDENDHHAHSISSFDPRAAMAEEQARGWSLDDSDAAPAGSSATPGTRAASFDVVVLATPDGTPFVSETPLGTNDNLMGASADAPADIVAVADVLPTDGGLEDPAPVPTSDAPPEVIPTISASTVRTLTLQIDHDYQSRGGIASQESISFDFDVVNTDVNSFAQEMVQSLMDQGSIAVDESAVPMFAAFLATQRFLPNVTLHVGPIAKWNWHSLQLGASDAMQEAHVQPAARAVAPASPGLHATNFMSPSTYTQARLHSGVHKDVPELHLDGIGTRPAPNGAAAADLPSAASPAASVTSRTQSRRLSVLSRTGTLRFDVSTSRPGSEVPLAHAAQITPQPHIAEPQATPSESDLTFASPPTASMMHAELSHDAPLPRNASEERASPQRSAAPNISVEAWSTASSPTRGVPSSVVNMDDVRTPSEAEHSPARRARSNPATATSSHASSVADSFASPPFSVASPAASPTGVVDNFLGSPPPVTLPYPHRADHAPFAHPSPSVGQQDSFALPVRQASAVVDDIVSPGVEARLIATQTNNSAADSLGSETEDDDAPSRSSKESSPGGSAQARLSIASRANGLTAGSSAPRGTSDSSTSSVEPPAGPPAPKPRDHELDSIIFSNLEALNLSNASGALRGAKPGDAGVANLASSSSGAAAAKMVMPRPQLPIGSMSAASLGPLGVSPVSAGVPTLSRTATFPAAAPPLSTPTTVTAMSSLHAPMHASQPAPMDFAFAPAPSYNMAFLPTPSPAGHFPAVLPPPIPLAHTPTPGHVMQHAGLPGPGGWPAPPVMMMPVSMPSPGMGMHQFAPATRGGMHMPVGMPLMPQYLNGAVPAMQFSVPHLAPPSCAVPTTLPTMSKVPLSSEFDPFAATSGMMIPAAHTSSMSAAMSGLSNR